MSGPRLALVGAGAIVTGPGSSGPVRHPAWDHLGIRTGVGIGIENGRVALIERDSVLRDWVREPGVTPAAPLVECGGRIVTAGLIDAHTHGVFGKARLDDQARRARGEDYKAIAAAGGGILSSVADFRRREVSELVELTAARLAYLAALGSTTMEVKSGYGLSLEAELKALEVIHRVAQLMPVRLVPTFLGAHEVPAEYRQRRDAYVRLVIEDMIPAVAAAGLAVFCDVFCEPGVFSLDETAAILDAARAHGLKTKLHADELDPIGGAELAARLGATSADHLGAISRAGIEALAASQTVAVLLPGTLTFLGKNRQAPARELFEAGAIVALATDFNPGSSPTGNLPLVMALAVSQARFQPEEAFVAATVNAAAAIGLGDGAGRIEVGSRADLVVWNARDVRELCYWYGMPLAHLVLADGRPCPVPYAGVSSAGSTGSLLSPPST